MDNILGEAILQFLFYNPSKVGVGIGEEQESTLSKKEFTPLGACFSYKYGLHFEKDLYSREPNGKSREVFPFVKIAKSIKMYPHT